MLAGQRQWIATTNFAGCPGRPQIALRIAPCSLPRQKFLMRWAGPSTRAFLCRLTPKRNSLSRLWPVQISDHSPFTFSSPRRTMPCSVGKYLRLGCGPKLPRWCGTESTRPRLASFTSRSRRVEAGTRPKRDSSSTVARGAAHASRRASSRLWLRAADSATGTARCRRFARAWSINLSLASSSACALPPTRSPPHGGWRVPCVPVAGTATGCGGTRRGRRPPWAVHAARRRCARRRGWPSQGPVRLVSRRSTLGFLAPRRSINCSIQQ